MMYRTLSAVRLLVLALAVGACVEEPLARESGFAPPSLEGTEVDGVFHYDQDGNFIFDQDAQRVFDYVLTAEGELSTEELHRWVGAMIASQVPSDQRVAVTASWNAYTRYRAAAAALVAEGAGDLQQQHQQAHEAIAGLLDTLSGDDVLAGTPFAISERDRLVRAVAVHDVQFSFQQNKLDRVQRDAALGEIDRDARARFEQTRAGRFLAARKALAAARAHGVSDDALHDLRVTHYDALSPGAAARLAALDKRRAAWDARVVAYERACDALRADWTGSEADLFRELADLADARFSDREQLRLF